MPSGVYVRSDKYRKLVSEKHKGTKRPPRSNEWKTKQREANKGKVLPVETRNKMSRSHLGKKFTNEHKCKIANALRGRKGSNWRGGISSPSMLIRKSPKYSEWRTMVYLRDNWTCRKCNKYGGIIDVHHIKSFSTLMKEARKYMPLFDIYTAGLLYAPLWDLNNGVTLCRDCHKKTKSYIRRIN